MKKNYTYPFTAIVGQEEMKLALILNIINPAISGVLIRGEKGTAKSTAVRALADILPEIEVIAGIPFNLAPDEDDETIRECFTVTGHAMPDPDNLEVTMHKVQVVELPVGATEDRVVGTLDLEHALKTGEKRIEPGLLAAAHRGILYVDEVNLLDDHVVDVLLDSAAMGVNTIEREGVSFSHPARFTLVGTMNPEEGELRPQLLDRFGLCVHVGGIADPQDRVTVMERRFAFEQDQERFCSEWQGESSKLAERIVAARELYPSVTISREHLLGIAKSCLKVGVDGHRGDIIIMKTAKTIAAWEGRHCVGSDDIDRAVALALPHRIRRQPLQDMVMDVGSLLGSKCTTN
ncbi:MAG TPA: magnesium chelatase ATPase subunit I [Chlorobaculum sp.]|uniref:Mg-protoporphyrin IX chelatase n=1 Tax=Chlorobaculum tepidum (strain ATCC 49652 / DSM 12025 / NBRC 103806 / TLS) TaxID=194439 RepID=Q8KFA6_CHLTE|nr:ATP-binding protein [Chlorobaculum tepidum]AAM71667.1 magnesium-chelatase, subunit I family [Chlorobaculum tepidum TLS]HBU23891.1 magnesium chelatase ATPase subunit I [Chlorobaculum sp.]